MSFPTVQVRDLVEVKTGTKNPTATSSEIFTYVDVAAVDNEAKAITGQRRLLGSEAPSRARKLIRQGDVLVSTVRPNLNAVALVPASLEGAIASTGFCVLRANSRALPEYLLYFVRSRGFVESLCTLVAGAMYPAVSDSQVLDQRLHLPPLPEQRRIVDVLSRAEGIVRLRREAEKKAAELIPALFNDMFGDPATNPKGWTVALLGTVAQIQGGIQVTTKRDIYPLELPYLRVANVHRSRLELSEIKTIRLTPAEFTRIKLLRGDLLVVEGHGNPQEIGRVAIWDGSIADCVHQNHLVRARCNPLALLPTFASAFLNSTSGRQFLLRSGKTTSGLTTISVSNVKAATILLPPMPLQTDFESKCESVRSVQSQQSTATAKAQATFDALLADAFKGT